MFDEMAAVALWVEEEDEDAHHNFRGTTNAPVDVTPQAFEKTKSFGMPKTRRTLNQPRSPQPKRADDRLGFQPVVQSHQCNNLLSNLP